jgi:hypothetical protein
MIFDNYGPLPFIFPGVIFSIIVLLIIRKLLINRKKSQKFKYCLVYLVVPTKRDSLPNQAEFIKAQPYFCEICKTFLTTLREKCENCGANNNLRKATKQDYEQYVKQSKLLFTNNKTMFDPYLHKETYLQEGLQKC